MNKQHNFSPIIFNFGRKLEIGNPKWGPKATTDRLDTGNGFVIVQSLFLPVAIGGSKYRNGIHFDCSG
jgi:hypothetical protein